MRGFAYIPFYQEETFDAEIVGKSSTFGSGIRTDVGPVRDGSRRTIFGCFRGFYTYGYNLGDNRTPSDLAFPSLVAKQKNYRLTNLGVPGAKSSDLIALLRTSQFRQAVREADVITLNIGSNDFLQGAKPIIDKMLANPNYQPTRSDYVLISSISFKFAVNLHIPSNQVIRSMPRFYEDVYVADAFAAFTGNQHLLVIPRDVHPNKTGHEVLALLASSALATAEK